MKCLGPLTDAELAALLTSGYTLLGGPYASEADCLAACSSTGTGTVAPPSACPCDPLPDTVYVTATSADCPCLDGTMWTLTRTAFYEGVANVCGWVNYDVGLRCVDGQYVLAYSSTRPVTLTVISCSPLHLRGVIAPDPDNIFCTPATITWDVTE